MTNSKKQVTQPERQVAKRIEVRESTLTHRVLNTKEEKFVLNYTLLMNGVAAVYASDLTDEEKDDDRKARAGNIASRMLRDPDIQNAIGVRLEYLAARNAISKDRISTMLLDIFDSARDTGDQDIARRCATDLAKLHGLMVLQSKHEFVWRIEDMSEEQMIKLLGRKYSPKLVEKLENLQPVDGKVIKTLDESQEK